MNKKMNIRMMRRHWVGAAVATCVQLAYGAAHLPAASDGIWEASIAAGNEATVLRVKRSGTPPELKTNTQFLPPSVAQTNGEWSVRALSLVQQKLTVVLRLAPQPGGDFQDKLFEFDLSQSAAPLVRFDTITHRSGRYDVYEFDLISRKSAWCRAQKTPDLANCNPVTENLLARQDAADIGLETMPSAERYAAPVVPNIVYGAEKPESVPLPQPSR